MNIALLTAAGKSTRMHMNTPKQFICVKGKPVIAYTMEAFQNHASIDAIIVVTLPQWESDITELADRYGITKLKWIAYGGETGQESIYNGLKKLSQYCSSTDAIMVHDGNRPLISEEIISNSLAVFQEKGGAVAAIPCIEAIFQSKDGVSSRKDIPREQLYRTQTPHTFTLEKMLWAHGQAAQREIVNTTATCVLMRMLGETIYFSMGSEKNLKITTQDDLDVFEALLESETKHYDEKEA